MLLSRVIMRHLGEKIHIASALIDIESSGFILSAPTLPVRAGWVVLRQVAGLALYWSKPGDLSRVFKVFAAVAQW